MRVIFVLLVIGRFDPCTIHIFRAKSYFGYFSNFWIYQIRGYPDQKSDLANRSGMPFYVESYGACFLPFCVWKKLWPKNWNFNGILSDYPKSGPGTFFPKKKSKKFFLHFWMYRPWGSLKASWTPCQISIFRGLWPKIENRIYEIRHISAQNRFCELSLWFAWEIDHLGPIKKKKFQNSPFFSKKPDFGPFGSFWFPVDEIFVSHFFWIQNCF